LNVLVNLYVTDQDTISTTTNNVRYFPFRADTTGTSAATTVKLYFSAYTDGQNTFNTNAAIALSTPSAAMLGATNTGSGTGSGSGGNGKVDDNMLDTIAVLGAANAPTKDATLSVTGMIRYEIAAGKWGGAASGC
jgi:hypothetical protein